MPSLVEYACVFYMWTLENTDLNRCQGMRMNNFSFFLTSSSLFLLAHFVIHRMALIAFCLCFGYIFFIKHEVCVFMQK